MTFNLPKKLFIQKTQESMEFLVALSKNVHILQNGQWTYLLIIPSKFESFLSVSFRNEVGRNVALNYVAEIMKGTKIKN